MALIQYNYNYTGIVKTFLKMKEYVGIHIKNEKAQEQDWDAALLWQQNYIPLPHNRT